MAVRHDTFGAMMVGVWIALVMYGITTLQTFHYYQHYPKDRKSTKILVAVLWCLDTLHVIFMCHAIYFYLIDSFGNLEPLTSSNWSLVSSITVNIIIAFIVQSFFTQRIYTLCRTRKWLITGVIAFFVFAHFAFGIETVVFIYIKKEFTRIREISFYAAAPFAVTVVISDILISVALCKFLSNSRTGYSDTNTLINRLIVFSINRCVLICVVALVELIVFIVKPKSLYVFAIDFIVGKLYVNALLASLNSRQALRDTLNVRERTDGSTDLSTSFNLATLPHSTIRTETATNVPIDRVELDGRDSPLKTREEKEIRSMTSGKGRLDSKPNRSAGFMESV